MKWYQSAAVIERLAASYALGTLAGGARRRFETVMRMNPHIAKQVAQWDVRLQPMAQRLPPLKPSADLWANIERRSFRDASAASTRAAPAPSPARAGASRMPPRGEPWWRKLFAPVPAGALAFGLVLGLLPTLAPLLQGGVAHDTQLPESYVGVLATAEGRTGLIISSKRQGTVMDIKQVTPVPVPAGQTLFVWVIEASGALRPIGPVPAGSFVQVALPQPADALFKTAVELGVSLEAPGSTPSAPSGAFVYRGLCGKLWRVPTAPAAK